MKTQTFDLKKMEVAELSDIELEQIDGGLFWIPVGIGIGLGYFASKAGSPGKQAPSSGCNVTVNNYYRR